jgi:type IV fimbrial biogenesis protein FimT
MRSSQRLWNLAMFKRPSRIGRQFKQTRFTLVESCVALGISGALLGHAVPAFQDFQQQQRVKLAAQSVAEDLRWAHAEAVNTGDTIIIDFGGKLATQCYVVHTGAAGDCACTANGQAICKAGTQALRTQAMAVQSGIQFRSNAASLHIEPRHGLVSSTASVEISDSKGRVLKEIVAITGRVRGCIAAGQLPGWKACA